MSVLISLHAASLRKFLVQLRKDREVYVCNSEVDWRILSRLNLSGKEERPFSEREINKVLSDYKYFEAFFKKRGLWL